MNKMTKWFRNCFKYKIKISRKAFVYYSFLLFFIIIFIIILSTIQFCSFKRTFDDVASNHFFKCMCVFVIERKRSACFFCPKRRRFTVIWTIRGTRKETKGIEYWVIDFIILILFISIKIYGKIKILLHIKCPYLKQRSVSHTCVWHYLEFEITGFFTHKKTKKKVFLWEMSLGRTILYHAMANVIVSIDLAMMGRTNVDTYVHG